MKKLTTKEYLEAVEHWVEIYESFVVCERHYRRNTFYTCFVIGGKQHTIGHGSNRCSYCRALTVVDSDVILCSLCLLYDIRCNADPSPWRDFFFAPSKETAYAMLRAIIERPPADYPKTREEFLDREYVSHTL